MAERASLDDGLGSRRRERAVPWAVAAVLLAAAGVAGSIWRPYAPPVEFGATDLDQFDAAVQAAVDAYRTPRYVVGVAATVVTTLVPVLFLATARGRASVQRWAGEQARSPFRAARVAVMVAAATSLAGLPLAIWSRLLHDGRWGFRARSAGGWVLDWLLVSTGRWLVTGILVALLFAGMGRWPRTWPYRLTFVGTALAAVFVALHPLVVQPLLLPTSPFPPGETRAAIERVLAAAGDPDVTLLLGEASLRTTRVNAVVAGLGPTERIVVHDTFLELPPEQVASVVAHEVAHREHADLGRGVLLGAAGVLLVLVALRVVLHAPSIRQRPEVRGPTDPRLAAVVLAAVAILELVGNPVANSVSRRVELAADARALELTGDPALLIRTTRAFTVRDLSAPDPPLLLHRYYGTHPSVGQRVRYAAAWADANGIELPTRAALEAEEEAIAHPAVMSGPP